MEVILRQAIEKLGNPGDLVKVSPGYARNYLIPRGIAYEATPGNVKYHQASRKKTHNPTASSSGRNWPSP